MGRAFWLIPCVAAFSLAAAFAHAQSGGSDDLLAPAGQEAPAPQPTAQTPAPAPSARPAPSEADRAFDEALRSIMPMSPEQIGQFKQIMEKSRRAAEAPVVDAKPISRSISLTLKPGEEPPVIHLSSGHVSTLTFSDVTGQSWPVLTVATGNPDAYVAQSAGPEGKTNIIVISPRGTYAPSNLVVTLVGHPVPIIVTLKTGDVKTDYRVDLKVEARGPNATYDVIGSTLPPTGDHVMMAFLDGVPPDGAVRLKTATDSVEAWRFKDMLYVRTRNDLLSPAYISKSSNVSGTNVYALVETPVLLLSEQGRMKNIAIGR